MHPSSAKAIIGGEDIEHSSSAVSSSAVALQMSEVQSNGGIRYYKGSAFLIDEDLLLTAGHNVAYIPEPNRVEAIFSSKPCWGPNVCDEKRIIASRMVVHPRFRQIPGGTEFDLAVVKLASNAPAGFKAIETNDSPSIIRNRQTQVIGYGADRETPDIPLSAFRLRSILLPALNPNYRFGSEQKFWLDQTSGGICGGDSGSPAVIDITRQSRASGIAIHVIHENGSSNCLVASAFTDLLFFKNWISETVNNLKKFE